VTRLDNGQKRDWGLELN